MTFSSSEIFRTATRVLRGVSPAPREGKGGAPLSRNFTASYERAFNLDAGTSNGTGRKLAMGVAAVALVGVAVTVGVLSKPQTTEVVAEQQAPAESVFVAAALPESDTGNEVVTRSVDDRFSTAALFGAMPAVMDDADDVAVVPREVSSYVPACVQTMERRIDGLHELSIDTASDTKVIDELRDLSQIALDCGEASLHINGSLELIKTNIADLRVMWDRDISLLELRVIDKTISDQIQVGRNEDGRAVDFVIR